MSLRHSRLSPDLLETFPDVRIHDAALFSSQHRPGCRSLRADRHRILAIQEPETRRKDRGLLNLRIHRGLFVNRSPMASPKVPDCSDVPRRYQKSSTPMAISTCSPPSVKSAADSGQQAEAFALVDHLHWCVASAPRVGSHLRPPLTRTATAPRQPSPPRERLPCPTSTTIRLVPERRGPLHPRPANLLRSPTNSRSPPARGSAG